MSLACFQCHGGDRGRSFGLQECREGGLPFTVGRLCLDSCGNPTPIKGEYTGSKKCSFWELRAFWSTWDASQKQESSQGIQNWVLYGPPHIAVVSGKADFTLLIHLWNRDGDTLSRKAWKALLGLLDLQGRWGPGLWSWRKETGVLWKVMAPYSSLPDVWVSTVPDGWLWVWTVIFFVLHDACWFLALNSPGFISIAGAVPGP